MFWRGRCYRGGSIGVVGISVGGFSNGMVNAMGLRFWGLV